MERIVSNDHGSPELSCGRRRAGGIGTEIQLPGRRHYFPNFHVDPRNEKIHGPGWTEWELLKHAEPKFKGHRQPKRPLWGYEDESDPSVFARKIGAAADHGLTHFIFDWYWFNDGPFLERGLERSYLRAANRQKIRFSLMWANHDWVDIHPAKRGVPPPLLYPGKVTRETFERMPKSKVVNTAKKAVTSSTVGEVCRRRSSNIIR